MRNIYKRQVFGRVARIHVFLVWIQIVDKSEVGYHGERFRVVLAYALKHRRTLQEKIQIGVNRLLALRQLAVLVKLIEQRARHRDAVLLSVDSDVKPHHIGFNKVNRNVQLSSS